MKRLVMSFTLFLFVLPALASAQDLGVLESAKKGLSGSLTGSMQDELEISRDQAEGGIGSVLSLAQENLSAGEFSRLSGMIPGADTYLGAAKSLGAVTGPLKNVAGLNEALGRLGMSPDVVSRFVPTLTDTLSKFGGGDAAKLLTTALGTG
ncbi:MAG: DUF2780 domain-containing protein [Gammaproteobacteria bacterium]|jgi:hypothetical protein|nr:MAG: hypothetical protein AMJ59_17630 [Gammaproteobacteria bacterium SG8_31]